MRDIHRRGKGIAAGCAVNRTGIRLRGRALCQRRAYRLFAVSNVVFAGDGPGQTLATKRETAANEVVSIYGVEESSAGSDNDAI